MESKGRCPRLKKFVENPYVTLTVAIILIFTGTVEAAESLVEDLRNVDLGVHHGVIVFGIVQALGSVAEIFDGLERL